MTEPLKLRLPSKKDWTWVLALILIGGGLGFALNYLSPVGINLTIALDLDSPPAPASASPAPGSPAPGSPAPDAAKTPDPAAAPMQRSQI
jgi:hypothetical protein